MITKAGLGFKLARTWPDTTRDREDLVKHAGGGRRYCPECGVTPRQGTGPLAPVRQLSLYELERCGTWLGGTPLPDNTPTWPLPAAHRKDADMFGRARRAAARDHAQQQARAQAEADALFAEADRLDDLAIGPLGYRQQITTERAARIRELLGPDLVRDARGAVGESRLQGADLDAEIDRLAEAYPEPEPAQDHPAVTGPSSASLTEAFLPEDRRVPADALEAGPPQSREEEIAELTAAGWFTAPDAEVEAPGDEPGVDAARWIPGQERDELDVAAELLIRHAAEAEGALRRERRATAHERVAQLARDEEMLSLSRREARNARIARRAATTDAYIAAEYLQRSALGPEPADAHNRYQHAGDYIGWSPDVTPRAAEHQVEAEPDDDCGRASHHVGPDHLYGSPDCAEADPETAHFGWSAAEPQDAGRFPFPRILPASEISPVRAPVAATLSDGTPHADPFLAGRGWQAQGGVYVRQPQAQLEAG